MRIIDKNQDFYDYLQDSTDTLVFDRRNSFILTKEIFCSQVRNIGRYRDNGIKFVLLQCGNTFWLFLVTMTDYDNFGEANNYKIELLTSWKNYSKKRELIKLSGINIHNIFITLGLSRSCFTAENIMNSIDKLKYAIDTNDFDYESDIGKYVKYIGHKNGYKKEIHDIPILKACGIGQLVDPIEIFCAIEEYFSLEKTASETTEPKGATNDDKITMHGFNTKTSFRGKQ